MTTNIYVSSGHKITDKQIKDENLYVLNGGRAIGTKVLEAAEIYVNAGGAISSTNVQKGGAVTVSAGGRAVDTLLDGRLLTQTQGALISGTASYTTVGTEWVETVYSGGVTKHTTVLIDGTESVVGGTTIDDVVSAFGVEEGWGTQISTTLENGGSQVIFGGGTSSGTRIEGGGESVNAGGTSCATTVFAGGNEFVSAGGMAENTVLSGGNLTLDEGAQTSGVIIFAAKGSELVISGGSMPKTEITGFGPGDKIQLKSVKYSTTGTVSVTTGEVTIDIGTRRYTLNIAGAQAGATNYVFSHSTLTETAPGAMSFLHPASASAPATPLSAAVTSAAQLSPPSLASSTCPATLTHDFIKPAADLQPFLLSAHTDWL